MSHWYGSNGYSMGLEDFDNPYRAPEVHLEVARETILHRQYFWVRLWIILQMVVAIAGCVAAFYDVETIVATGPILSIVGILGAITSFRRKVAIGLWASISAPAISLGVFLLIFLRDWSPSYAQGPVPIIGTIYTVALCVMGILAIVQTRLRQSAFEASGLQDSLQQDTL